MGEHEPTGAEDGVAEVKSGSPVSDADRATPSSEMPHFDMPKDTGEKDTHAVDTSDPNFAVDKFRKSSGVIRTDPSGYGIRNEYQPRGREAAYRKREGLDPHRSAAEQATPQPAAPTPERPGLLSKVRSFFRGQR